MNDIYTSSEDQKDNIELLHEHNINIENREIFLTSWLDNENNEESGVEYRMATQFIKNLSILEHQNHYPILIRMHSIGGMWNDGIAIYDAIKTAQSPIIIMAYAHARSMTSIILQGATRRILMPNTQFMIHLGTLEDSGEYQAVMSSLNMTKKEADIMLNIYANRCQIGPFFQKKSYTNNSIKKFLTKQMRQKTDWWLTAEEALKYGFCDGIFGQSPYLTIEDVINV